MYNLINLAQRLTLTEEEQAQAIEEFGKQLNTIVETINSFKGFKGASSGLEGIFLTLASAMGKLAIFIIVTASIIAIIQDADARMAIVKVAKSFRRACIFTFDFIGYTLSGVYGMCKYNATPYETYIINSNATNYAGIDTDTLKLVKKTTLPKSTEEKPEEEKLPSNVIKFPVKTKDDK